MPFPSSIMVVRPVSLRLTDLLIPSDQPNHGTVRRLKAQEPPKQPTMQKSKGFGFVSHAVATTNATTATTTDPIVAGASGKAPPPSRIASASSAVPRQNSASHLHRIRDLRKGVQSHCATPSLSPLNIQSPKVVISKLPRPAAGGGARYAAYLKAWAKQAELSGQVPGMRVVNTGGGAVHTHGNSSGLASRTATPGLRARASVPRRGGPPLQPSRIQRPAALRQYQAAVVAAGGAR